MKKTLKILGIVLLAVVLVVGRIADGLYVPGKSFVLTVDGFIVSDNIQVDACSVIDDGFTCSDHNPVVMNFELKE